MWRRDGGRSPYNAAVRSLAYTTRRTTTDTTTTTCRHQSKASTHTSATCPGRGGGSYNIQCYTTTPLLDPPKLMKPLLLFSLHIATYHKTIMIGRRSSFFLLLFSSMHVKGRKKGALAAFCSQPPSPLILPLLFLGCNCGCCPHILH